MKIKVLHVITSLKLGGAETVLFNIANNLDKALDQTVIYFYDGPIRIKLENIGIKTYKVNGFFCLYDFLFFVNLFNLINKIKPDVIHASLWSANFFSTVCAKLLNIPIVYSLHTVKYHQGTLRNFLDYFITKYNNRIIAVSNSVALSFKNIIEPNKITTIKNAIDIDLILNETKKNSFERKLLNLEPGDFIIGAVGRFEKVKRFDLIIDCLFELRKKYKNIKLVLVGNGKKLKELEEQTYKLNLSNYIKFVIAKPALNYYSIFDCFVQSSQYEGLSIALLEAMSYSLPCIVTTNGEHEVIINHHNGLLAKASSIVDLCNKIEYLYLKKDQRLELGINGYKTVKKNFSIQNMVKQYSDIFLDLVN